jgi:hypothetical protein
MRRSDHREHEIDRPVTSRLPLTDRLRKLKYGVARRWRYQPQYGRLHPPNYTRALFRAEARTATALYMDLLQAIGTDRIVEFDAEFAHPIWVGAKRQVATSLVRGLPEAFLDHPVLRHQMVRRGWGALQDHEEQYLLSRSSPMHDRLAGFTESRVGLPFLESRAFRCSSNTLGHLYYFARLDEAFPGLTCGCPKIVEFGGGYGNFARVYAELGSSRSYTVIDFPELLALQYLFLRLNGLDPVVQMSGRTPQPHNSVFRLVPVQLLPGIDLHADLFISHFGLSEAPAPLQDMVIDRQFMECESIFLNGQYEGQQPGHDWAPHGPLHDAIQKQFGHTRIDPFPVSWAYEATATRRRPSPDSRPMAPLGDPADPEAPDAQLGEEGCG